VNDPVAVDVPYSSVVEVLLRVIALTAAEMVNAPYEAMLRHTVIVAHRNERGRRWH